MTKILPFKAVRPTRDKAGLVASRPYEDYSNGELTAQLEYNPFSFLHIINPGYKFQHSIKGDKRFQLVKNRYLEFKEDNIFFKDEEPAYYIYKIITRANTYMGIIAAASVEDYENNCIRKHEDTIELRENLFKEYLKVVGFNTEPVLLTYPDSPVIGEILETATANRPEYEFSTYNKETHYLWRIDDKDTIATIQGEFEQMSCLYIADGHHRCASSYLLAKESKDNNPGHTGTEPYNSFMSFLIPESELKIYEFSRLITDLNGWSKEEFLVQLDEWFRIENRGQEVYYPSKKHHFNMYLEGEFYSLYLRKTNYEFTDSLSTLDTYILYDKILKPVLGIEDLRNDSRIAYIHGKNDLVEIKTQVDSGKYKVGFGMLPITIDEIKQVADEGLTMPPKSTYIEPKLRSGLTIYEF
ncbi:DUF1015 domain-containing protein [Antarcticibacterium flavum]|uniref:DUF1015 domain-containing protein n=1 Tax=Antarcticibacterium flavum TaxID=2058175 RepID=A0A5B7X6Z5_9FLAO|nr:MULTISPECIES: DUF1015 domain-containing protein [Antarcticibacterium]MCM4161048.1 DUF1015 domain-containing protein [Antarcticibacterium sp. W02-3]QCY70522.1 DUF1015 domain-containing protein [Antarcticibacterium flavum]